MKKLFMLLLCGLMLCTFSLALADEAEITAQGTAEIAAEPDMFTIVTNVSLSEITVARAQESVAAVIESATKKLIELGVKEEDIVTQDFSYYPDYDYSGDNPKLTGYRVNHSLRVTCRELGMLDSVMAVLTDSGMTETWNISFDISTRSELYRQALSLAFDAAEKKAETMANAAGLTLSCVNSIKELSSGDVARYANTEDAAVMLKASAAGGGIRSGDVTVSASVTVVFDAK